MRIATDWPRLAGAGLVARLEDPSPDLEADFAQLGRNLADKCLVSFCDQVAAETSDPALVAAALRGRQEVLDAAIHVVVATERTVVARVRDDRGVWDVTRGSATGGWFCTCGEYGCAHVAAVRQVTR